MNFLNKILNLNGTFYEWNEVMNDISGKQGYEYGLIAQEVQKEFPEMISVDDDGFLTVDYIQMIPVLVECIKELKSEIDDLKKINSNT